LGLNKPTAVWGPGKKRHTQTTHQAGARTESVNYISLVSDNLVILKVLYIWEISLIDVLLS